MASRTLPSDAPNWRFAGLWIRGLAALADILLLIITSILLFAGAIYVLYQLDPALLVRLKYELARGDFKFLERWGPVAILTCYEVLLTATSTRATLGKQLLGIRVIARNGERVGFLQSFWRYTIKYTLSIFFFYLCIITIEFPYYNVLGIISLLLGAIFVPAIWIAINRRKRGIHDYLSATAVVYYPY